MFSPNLIYLIKDKLNAVNYALDRSGSNENQVFSLVDILKSSLGAFYETILVIVVLLILFVTFINKKRLRSFIFSEDIFNNHRIRRLFFFAGVFSILIPLLIMLIMGADKFYAKWLSPSCFLVVFAFYSCIDFHKKAGENVEIGVSLHAPKAFLLRRNLLYVIVSSCFLVSASVLFIGGFFPDLIGKVTKTQYPYAKLASILYREYQEELALTKDGKLKLILITNGDPVLKGNLVLALEKTGFKKLLKSGDCQLKSLNELKDSEGGENVGSRLEPKALSLYVWDARIYGRSIPKGFQSVIGNAEDDENAEIGALQHGTARKRTSSRLRRTNDRSVLLVHEDHEDDENAEIEDCEQSHKYKLVKVRYINSEKQYYELGILK